MCNPTCILATNTSSIDIEDIGAVTNAQVCCKELSIVLSFQCHLFLDSESTPAACCVGPHSRPTFFLACTHDATSRDRAHQAHVQRHACYLGQHGQTGLNPTSPGLFAVLTLETFTNVLHPNNRWARLLWSWAIASDSLQTGSLPLMDR